MRACFLCLLFCSVAWAESGSQKIQTLQSRDFQARGQAGMDRVQQDGLQRLCTESGDKPPADVAKALEADQMKTIAFPAGSLIGDWRRGERIAQGGTGSRKCMHIFHYDPLFIDPSFLCCSFYHRKFS